MDALAFCTVLRRSDAILSSGLIGVAGAAFAAEGNVRESLSRSEPAKKRTALSTDKREPIAQQSQLDASATDEKRFGPGGTLRIATAGAFARQNAGVAVAEILAFCPTIERLDVSSCGAIHLGLNASVLAVITQKLMAYQTQGWPRGLNQAPRVSEVCISGTTGFFDADVAEEAVGTLVNVFIVFQQLTRLEMLDTGFSTTGLKLLQTALRKTNQNTFVLQRLSFSSIGDGQLPVTAAGLCQALYVDGAKSSALNGRYQHVVAPQYPDLAFKCDGGSAFVFFDGKQWKLHDSDNGDWTFQSEVGCAPSGSWSHKSLQTNISVKAELTGDLRSLFPFLEEVALGPGPADTLVLWVAEAKARKGGLGGGVNRFAATTAAKASDDAAVIAASAALTVAQEPARSLGRSQRSGAQEVADLVAAKEVSPDASATEASASKDAAQEAATPRCGDQSVAELVAVHHRMSVMPPVARPQGREARHRMSVTSVDTAGADADADADLDDSYDFESFDKSASQVYHRMSVAPPAFAEDTDEAVDMRKRNSLEGMYDFDAIPEGPEGRRGQLAAHGPHSSIGDLMAGVSMDLHDSSEQMAVSSSLAVSDSPGTKTRNMEGQQ